MSATEERRATMRLRREQAQQNRNARREGGGGGGGGGGDHSSGDYSSSHRRQAYSQKNLGDKPLQESVYSTSLRTLGHSIDGKVTFTTSSLPALGLTSLRPIAQLGSQLQRIVVDNNALESLEDLQDCVSLVHLSAVGNKLGHSTTFPHLVGSANTLNYLNLSDNNISTLQGVERLRFLVTLTLDGNQLSSLEVDGTEESLQASANEAVNEHCSAMLDDVIKAVDETIARGKPRSRRGSMHESSHGAIGRESSNLSRGQSMFAKQKSLHIKGIARAADEEETAGPVCSPLRFLVSLWRFSAANNDIKEVRPAVFERCPLRLLNLSNNAICDLDFVLPLNKTLMVLTLDGNDVSHLPASTAAGTSGGGGIRRLGSRHMGDSVHGVKAVHHPEVAHLNFQMMHTLVSLNLARNNIASFNEISELRHLPQLRHLTLAQCTLCSLPTAADLNVREDALKKKRLDGVRNDHDMGKAGLDATAVTADRIAQAAAAGAGAAKAAKAHGDDDAFNSGIFGPRSETVNIGAPNCKNPSRKQSMVVINSPSMADFGSNVASESVGSGPVSQSASFTVEALIRPDDAEAVTFRTPEEQDAVEFNKRTTEERYRLKVLMHVPQLQTLDGVPCTTEDIAEAQQLAGGYLREERTRAIAKYIKPAGGSAGAALRRLIAPMG